MIYIKLFKKWYNKLNGNNLNVFWEFSASSGLSKLGVLPNMGRAKEDNCLQELNLTKECNGMKKTCMNCTKYHATLVSNEGLFHIHDWCEQWKTVLYAYALADKMDYECPFYSDLETGEAFCYMFEAVDKPTYSDEWFDRKKAENELHAKKKLGIIHGVWHSF